MEEMKCRKGQIIIREGEAGACMYNILWGRVGVYSGYGTDHEKKLAELGENDFFGEMELLDGNRRSATVVALEAGTRLEIITEADFREFFANCPAKVFFILQRLCQKLRKTTQDYLQVCRTVYDAVELQKQGWVDDPELEAGIAAICEHYQAQQEQDHGNETV